METFKVIVAGGRDFRDYDKVRDTLDALLREKSNVEIVSGGASGADYFGERYAKERQIRCSIFPAKWNKYGKKAGVYRNTEMSNYANALVAFWNGSSIGTKDMIDKAKSKKLETRVIRVSY